MKTVQLILRLGLAIVFISFGVDQLVHGEVWFAYLPSFLHWIAFGNHAFFMQMHALGNIALGILLLTGYFHPWVAGFATVWLASITIATFFVDWTIAVRDLGLAATALALYFL